VSCSARKSEFHEEIVLVEVHHLLQDVFVCVNLGALLPMLGLGLLGFFKLRGYLLGCRFRDLRLILACCGVSDVLIKANFLVFPTQVQVLGRLQAILRFSAPDRSSV